MDKDAEMDKEICVHGPGDKADCDNKREPCSRCGDPDGGGHSASEEGTAAERNCNLYRIGTQLERLNDILQRIEKALPVDLLKLCFPDGVLPPEIQGL